MEIKNTRENYRFALINLIVCMTVIFGFILVVSENLLFIIVGIFIALKFFIYQVIELWFKKKIVEKNNSLLIEFMGLSLPINRDDSYLVIQNTINISHSGAKHPTLNIHRNMRGFFHRFFKNTVKLNYVGNNLEKIKKEARLISETFGIRFIDDFEDD